MSQLIFKPKLVYRKDLKKKFENILINPLSLIVSPAGYGKTLSTRRFLNTKRKFTKIWFTLYKLEIDSMWVWQSFCEALKLAYPILGNRFSNYGIPQNNIDINHFINAIKLNIDKPTILIIDNFHYINNKYIASFIENLIYKNIENLHILIISQSYPDFNYDKLLKMSYIHIIDQDSIKFRKEDISQFFYLNGFDLKQDEINKILNYTKGQPAFTYLFMLYYVKTHNLNNSNKIETLIETEIYNKFDTDDKNSLMKLSLLDSFTIPQAIAVTKSKKVASIIKKLNKNNCFIKFNSIDETYKFNYMFREMLQDFFKFSDLNSSEIYNDCALFYYNDRNYIKAIIYYYKAQNYEPILHIINRGLDNSIFHKIPQIITNVFMEIDISMKSKYPYAYICFIFFYILKVSSYKGQNMIDELRRLYELNSKLENRNHILGELSLIGTLFHFNDMDKIYNDLKEAELLFNGTSSKIYYSTTIFNCASPSNLNLIHNKIGKMYDTVKLAQNNISKYNLLTNGNGSGYEYLIKAEYYYKIGDIDNSELLSYKARFKARSKNQLGLMCSATFLLMRISILNGKTEDLKDYLYELINHIPKVGTSYLMTEYDIIMGYIYGSLGIHEKVASWILEYTVNSKPKLIQTLEFIYLTQSIVALSQNKFKQLEKLSASILDISVEKVLISNIIYAKIYESIAKFKLYGIEEAKPPIIEAINLAQADNILTPFAENIKYIIPILEIINSCDSANILFKCRKLLRGKSNIDVSEIANLNEF